VINDVRNGTGAVINTENDIPEPGRWQTLQSLSAPLDSDNDGIPDYWEKQYGLNPNDPSDAMKDSDGDGYTNIEEYVNNTDPVGGTLPLVYVSASKSRAWRGDNQAGEFRVWRSGSMNVDLKVSFTIGAKVDSVVIPRGQRYNHVPVTPAPGMGEVIVVLNIEASAQYRIGCPNRALVAIEDGGSPKPVQLASIDPKGGVTSEDLAWAERVMEQHVVKKSDKKARKQRNLADPNFKTKKPTEKAPQ
jgi:hypothetical protein